VRSEYEPEKAKPDDGSEGRVGEGRKATPAAKEPGGLPQRPPDLAAFAPPLTRPVIIGRDHSEDRLMRKFGPGFSAAYKSMDGPAR
jgi:hypothetical protein